MTFRGFNSLLVWALFALIPVVWIFSEGMLAHHSNRYAIRHDSLLTVGSRNIDIELELTFFAASSAKERSRMDLNGDGIILDEEAAAYRDEVASEIKGHVRILVDDRPLDTHLLYQPELDLLGEEANQPYPHLLRLFFFARTPAWIKQGSIITLEDRLWPEEVGIHSLKAEGIEGFEAYATGTENPVSRDSRPYLSSARCLTVTP